MNKFKLLITLFALSSLNFACVQTTGNQSTSPSPNQTSNPTPTPISIVTPTPTPVDDNPNVQFWVVDNSSNNYLVETSNLGASYSQTLLNDMPTINSVKVSGNNIAVLGLNSSGSTQLDVSTDNWITHSTVNLSAYSTDSIKVLTVSGQNLMIAGKDAAGNLIGFLSTDFGLTFNQITMPAVPANSVFAQPSPISIDSNSITIRIGEFSSNGTVNLFYSTDFENYLDVSSEIFTDNCTSPLYVTSSGYNAGQYFASCLGDVAVFNLAEANSKDVSSALSLSGFQTSNSQVVDTNGMNLIVGNFSNNTVAFSQDNGSTFHLIQMPSLVGLTIKSFGIF